MELRETALARHVSATVQTRDGEATDSAVCLLLGWTGGNPTLLRKAYGQKYLDAGMHLVVIAAPVPPLSGAEATRTFQTAVNSETWKLLFDGKRKVVLHCFSNGGGINLFHLIRVTRSHSNPLPTLLTSAIFDSVPGINSITDHAEYTLSTTLPKGGLDPATRTPWVVTKAYLHSVFWNIVVDLQLAKWYTAEKLGAKQNEENTPFWIGVYSVFWETDYPNLRSVKFLYSKKDRVSNHRAVSHAMDEMRRRIAARGRETRVSGRLFEDSEHVAHASRYPREYWTEVAESLSLAGVPEAGTILRSILGTKSKL